MNEPVSPTCEQLATAVLVVRPANFGSNSETRGTNAFQSVSATGDVASQSLAEFDAVVGVLQQQGVSVVRLDGNERDLLPDEVFPNNWFSTHADGSLVIYPMAATNRRRERRADLQSSLLANGYRVRRRIDLSHFERVGQYLEGTGSLIIDHIQRRVFVCRSPRSDARLANLWCELMGFRLVLFDAIFRDLPVYHTNVVLALGPTWALWAEDLVPLAQRSALRDHLVSCDRDVIAIDSAQVAELCGNALGLRGCHGDVILLSTRARKALRADQRRRLEAHASLVDVAIPTIEAVGGGGVRCMLAELRLPRVAMNPVCENA